MWEYFFATPDNIPAGMGFSLFGGCHLAWLGFAALLILISALAYRAGGEKRRRVMRFYCAAALIALEAAKISTLLIMRSFRPWYLPLHLCSINIFLILAHSIRPSRLAEELLYALCLPGAVIALLFPGWQEMPPANFIHIHSFLCHILLALYPVMLLAGGELRPDIRRLPKCAALLLLACALIYPLNLALGTNFFFLHYPGSGNPLVWFYERLGSPGYLVGLPVIAAALWALLYIPPTLLNRKK